MILALIRNNWGYKLLSMGLALMLWTYVQNAENPPVSKTFDVTPRIVDGPPNLRATTNVRKINVTVRDRRDVIARMRETDLTATISLRGATEGEHPFDVAVRYSARLLMTDEPRLEKVEPRTATFMLEAIKTRAIKIVLESEAPLGARWLESWIDPDQVMVRGPQSLLANLRVIARVDRRTAPVPPDGEVQEKVRLVLQDKAGQAVESSELQVEPSVVEFRGRLEVEAKQFHVQVVTTGTPASGYRVRGALEAMPSTVMLAGSEETLRSIGSVATEPIDLTGATRTIERVVRLALPAGVKVRGSSRIRVTIPIAEIAPAGAVPGPAPSRDE